MTNRELIQELLNHDLDAEAMISAPLSASKLNPRPGHLSIPCRSVSGGTFQSGGEGGPEKGSPWVCVQGTSAWGLYDPSER